MRTSSEIRLEYRKKAGENLHGWLTPSGSRMARNTQWGYPGGARLRLMADACEDGSPVLNGWTRVEADPSTKTIFLECLQGREEYGRLWARINVDVNDYNTLYFTTYLSDGRRVTSYSESLR